MSKAIAAHALLLTALEFLTERFPGLEICRGEFLACKEMQPRGCTSRHFYRTA